MFKKGAGDGDKKLGMLNSGKFGGLERKRAPKRKKKKGR